MECVTWYDIPILTNLMFIWQFEDTKGVLETENDDESTTQLPKGQWQTVIFKTLHRKLKIVKTEHPDTPQ